MMMISLYYYHDPMCSWCWGYRPTSDRLCASLPDSVRRVNILGGLAADSDEPMPKAMQDAIAGYWHKIHSLFGTEFNFDFWTRCVPRRSTYPACRAVIAAGHQHREFEMTDAIQRAYYLRAMNPSDLATLTMLAEELALDVPRFIADIRSADVDDELRRQICFTEQSPTNGLPSLALEINGTLHSVRLDYEDVEVTLAHIDELLKLS